VKWGPLAAGAGLFASLYWIFRPREAMTSTAPTASSDNLGVRALELARTQVGVTESTGKNDGDQIGQYFEGATRSQNGVEVPMRWSNATNWDWCAAFASWAAYKARKPGEGVPHGWRIAVWELVRDARKAGAWQDWTGTGPGPKPGSLVVFKRDNGDPRLEGQKGHVARVESWDGKNLNTIGGNEGNGVRLQDNAHRFSSIVGLIHYA